MSDYEDDANMPPPASQSHFETFDNFTPNDDAAFDDEFARLACSQDWVPGSQKYTRERTIAIRQEVKLHYFSQTAEDDPDRELTDEEKLAGYQGLCDEIGIESSESIDECKKNLKSTLVNIIDLIDARRMNKAVKVWDDFEAFRAYTLQDGHRIDPKEAKKGKFLDSLLQRLRGPGRSRRRRGGRNRVGARVVSGRVTKPLV